MLRYLVLFCLVVSPSILVSQFAPAAGHEGSTAIHKDSSAIQGWATACEIERGYIKISDTTLTYEGSNKPTQGEAADALGSPDGKVVSLGDGGTALLSFSRPIANGQGPDFVVFENAFKAQEEPMQYFLELAFVEVSSDGERFVRFPATSNTPVSPQVTTFGQLDPTKINNLAGKYEVHYGTPFDLEDLTDSSGIDLQNISHIKIIDVIGSVHPNYASYDVEGNPVNDPWPTPFASGGFDLEAVGVINYSEETGLKNIYPTQHLNIFPNPVDRNGYISISPVEEMKPGTKGIITLADVAGRKILQADRIIDAEMHVQIPEHVNAGIYFVHLSAQQYTYSNILIVR